MVNESRLAKVLLGRDDETLVITSLLEGTRNGDGAAIVIHGEPGIGKTAILERAVALARDFNVLRTLGNEAEMELPYASLQDLFRPEIQEVEQLPHPQRCALEVALGRRDGQVPDRLLVGLGLLNLMSLVSTRRPVLCVVDDVQWLDAASAHAIGFAARHVSKDPVAFLLGSRTLTEEVRGIAELHIGGLEDKDARELLATALPDRLDGGVVDRLIAETHGNPLALLELPRGLTPSQLAGGFGPPVSVTLTGQIEESYRRRLARLSPGSRTLLLIVAADPTGDPGIIWRAASSLGIDEGASETIEDDGLVDFGERVVFRHPLVRSAVYKTANPRNRREAHNALAEATDAVYDPDRKAWHRAQATLHPNEAVADELEASAERAQSRGGYAAAGAFLERSVAFTVDPASRAVRALRAAQAKCMGGALDAASGLVMIAERGPLDDLHQAQLDALLGQIAFARSRGNEVSPLMLRAASRLEHVDLTLARDAYFDALIAAILSGHLAVEADVVAVAKAALAVPPSDQQPRASDVLLEGLSLLVTDGVTPGTAVLKRALSAFRGDRLSTEERLRWSWVAGGTAGLIWDHETWDLLTARHQRLARDLGALSILPISLSTRVMMCLFAGEMAAAQSLADQVEVVTDASDNRRIQNSALFLAAFRGDQPELQQLSETITSDAQSEGEGLALSRVHWATALLCNGRGEYEEAFRCAKEAVRHPNEFWYWGWAAVELIEAASRTNRTEGARSVLARFQESTDASGTEWALGVQARCRALLTDGAGAEALYQEAIDRLLPTRLQVDLARTRLLYGEWLRRQRRQRHARDQLRRAHELFVEFDMSAFAGRAEAELLATGERARKREVDTQVDLTPRELRISELATQGATNQDIAEQLFISPATVEYHLTKVYRKLGIRSRTQLANVLRSLPTNTRSALPTAG